MNDNSFATMQGMRTRSVEGGFAIGDTIAGRYKVVEELGRGGMGIVYKCTDTVSGIPVALKALPPELSHNTLEMEDVRDNFALVEKLNHPNIANVKHLERDRATGDYYLIMECVEGKNLKQILRAMRKSGGLPPEKIIYILRQTAAALDYAHSRQIIHRDIKPGNIMITADDTIKVLDFGLAAQIHTTLSRVSMAYGTSGTGPYMAPEQWRGKRQSAASDQYALAVMAYEMFSGELPFENADAAILKHAVLEESADPIEGIPLHVQNALNKAMSKDAPSRFPSCNAFVDALKGKGSPEKEPVKEEPSKAPETDRRSSGKFRKGAVVIFLILAGLWGYNQYSAHVAEERRIAEERRSAEERRIAEERRKKDPQYQYNQGESAYNAKNYDEAVKWFRKAANQGHAMAQNNLGFCYERGYGVNKDLEEAVKWYRKAANQGNVTAQCNLGVCYANGYGVNKDYYEAVKWYRKAANQGHADAQNDLGFCYERGYGVNKDLEEAVKWYRKAANQGNAMAQNNLGVCYDNGYGVNKDLEEAVKWFRKAALQGHATAKENLRELGR